MAETLDDALRSVARAGLASAFDSSKNEPHVHESSTPLLLALDSGLQELSWVQNQKGEILDKSSRLENSDIEKVNLGIPDPGSEWVLKNVDLKGQPYRLLVANLSHQGEIYREVFALSRVPLLRRLDSLKRQAGSMFLIAFIVLVVAAPRLSFRLTVPLIKLADGLEKLDPETDNSLSLADESTDREFQVLYKSVNSVLNKLEETLVGQKRFVSDTSHEIRAPLTNLRLAIEVCLRKQRSAEDYREVLEVCQQEVARLGNLAERLLTLSRLDSEQLPFTIQRIDLVRLTEQALELVQERLGQKKLQIDFQSPDVILVQADPDALRQVVDNLLENSIRYAPSGSTISIELQKKTSELSFSIENLGCQLTENQCSKIFQRFYRGDESRHRETGGSGLGLSIVEGLVNIHRGHVGAELLEKDKFRLWFTLPL